MMEIEVEIKNKIVDEFFAQVQEDVAVIFELID